MKRYLGSNLKQGLRVELKIDMDGCNSCFSILLTAWAKFEGIVGLHKRTNCIIKDEIDFKHP